MHGIDQNPIIKEIKTLTTTLLTISPAENGTILRPTEKPHHHKPASKKD